MFALQKRAFIKLGYHLTMMYFRWGGNPALCSMNQDSWIRTFILILDIGSHQFCFDWWIRIEEDSMATLILFISYNWSALPVCKHNYDSLCQRTLNSLNRLIWLLFQLLPLGRQYLLSVMSSLIFDSFPPGFILAVFILLAMILPFLPLIDVCYIILIILMKENLVIVELPTTYFF